MGNPQTPTKEFIPESSGSPPPMVPGPGPLPAPHADITLTEPLEDLGPGRPPWVWSATSARHPGKTLVVVFRQALPDPPYHQDRAKPRFILDLGAGIMWPPAAVVTVLPASLPGTYAGIQLKSFIGRGGMGEVWMAESPDYPGFSLAIKFLTHPGWHDRGFFAQFQKEAEAGIGISHAYIVSTLQFLDLREYVSESWPPAALVMLRHEPPLAEVIADLKQTGTRLPPKLAMEWSRNLLEALDWLGNRYERVHRDLKPSNVLLRRSPLTTARIRPRNCAVGGAAIRPGHDLPERGSAVPSGPGWLQGARALPRRRLPGAGPPTSS